MNGITAGEDVRDPLGQFFVAVHGAARFGFARISAVYKASIPASGKNWLYERVNTGEDDTGPGIMHRSRQGISWETAARMHFVQKDAGLHARITVHDPRCLGEIGGENADSLDIAPVRNWANDGKLPLLAKGKVAATVLPDDPWSI